MEEDDSVGTKQGRNVITREEFDLLTDGIARYEKAAFLVVGHRDGVRLAVPKTSAGIGRAYFYGNGDYSLIPSGMPAVTVFSAEQRKALRKGGIMAEVSFAALDDARAAVTALIGIVRTAEAPPPRGTKAPKAPRRPKSVVTTGQPPVTTD